MRRNLAPGTAGPKTGPGPAVRLVAAAITAYVVAAGIGLLAFGLLILIPAFDVALPPDAREAAFLVIQLVILVAVVRVGMRRERLNGGIAFLVVASLYAFVGLGLALAYSFGGAVAGLGGLIALAAWGWIYGSHGSPW